MSKKQELSKTLEESIDIEVPSRTAYNQWTQFEDFPLVMRGIERVRQIDDRHVAWQIHVDGRPMEWTAEIVEQIPDKRVAWRSTSGVKHAGVVTFHRLDDDRCRMMLQMDYEPEGLVQATADVLGVVRQEARTRLEEFKRYIEEKGVETGAWRGEIPSRDETSTQDTERR